MEVLAADVLERVEVAGRPVAGLRAGDVEADDAGVPPADGELRDLLRPGGLAHRRDERADHDRVAGRGGARSVPMRNPSRFASTTSSRVRPLLDGELRARTGPPRRRRRPPPGPPRTPRRPGRSRRAPAGRRRCAGTSRGTARATCGPRRAGTTRARSSTSSVGQVAVAELAREIHDRRRPQAAVEVVVEQRLGRLADRVEGEHRGSSGVPPIVSRRPARRAWSTLACGRDASSRGRGCDGQRVGRVQRRRGLAAGAGPRPAAAGTPGRTAGSPLAARHDVAARGLVVTLRGEEHWQVPRDDDRRPGPHPDRDPDRPRRPAAGAGDRRRARSRSPPARRGRFAFQLPVPPLGPATLDADRGRRRRGRSRRSSTSRVAMDSSIEAPVRDPPADRAPACRRGARGRVRAVRGAPTPRPARSRPARSSSTRSRWCTGRAVHAGGWRSVRPVAHGPPGGSCRAAGEGRGRPSPAAASETLVPWSAVVAPADAASPASRRSSSPAAVRDVALPTIELPHGRASAELHVILAGPGRATRTSSAISRSRPRPRSEGPAARQRSSRAFAAASAAATRAGAVPPIDVRPRQRALDRRGRAERAVIPFSCARARATGSSLPSRAARNASSRQRRQGRDALGLGPAHEPADDVVGRPERDAAADERVREGRRRRVALLGRGPHPDPVDHQGLDQAGHDRQRGVQRGDGGEQRAACPPGGRAGTRAAGP